MQNLLGLALGGGGARGLAHIGVLKVLEKNQIPISLIVGSSIGALIGSVYALNPDAKMLIEKMEKVLSGHGLFRLENFFVKQKERRITGVRKIANFLNDLYLMRLQSTKESFVQSDMMEGLIYDLVGDANFEDTKIPFVAVATDLLTGEKVVLGHGPLKQAVQASTAIAGAFPPIELHGRVLADGSIVSPVPAKIARDMGMDIVVAVDVGKQIRLKKKIKTITESRLQAEHITANELRRYKLKDADIIIEPRVGFISWAHFSKGKVCVRQGIKAAEKKINTIRLMISKKQKSKNKMMNILNIGKKLLRSKS